MVINREEKILEILEKQGSASIQQLVEELGVSNMTVHRDLNRMIEAGHIQKKHGGAVLVKNSPSMQEFSCAMCNKPSSGRTVFIVQFENGDKKRACCAHCGLMIQSVSKKVKQSLTADYLHGHIVSANQATYLVGSELKICCVPSILCFASLHEAEKFQKGFGGKLLNMEEAIKILHD
jgi:predicted ArsR family transcriptional regulator